MLKKRRPLFLGGILLLVLIVAARGYYLFQKPHQSAGGEDAAYTIQADSLYKQYQDDEKASDKKYLGKVLKVTGKLGEVQHAGQSEIWELTAGAGAAGGINCQLFAGVKLPSPHPAAGDQVVLKGRCTGFLMDVNLVDCVPSN